MNVMAKAHELTRTVMANAEGGVYATILKHALIHFHKEFKAMHKFADQIAKTEAFIEELKAADTSGFIVVTGEHRVCVNPEQIHATNVLKAPIYMSVEEASYWADRVQNGNGEGGYVVSKVSQLQWEIGQQQELIKTLKVCKRVEWGIVNRYNASTPNGSKLNGPP